MFAMFATFVIEIYETLEMFETLGISEICEMLEAETRTYHGGLMTGGRIRALIRALKHVLAVDLNEGHPLLRYRRRRLLRGSEQNQGPR